MALCVHKICSAEWKSMRVGRRVSSFYTSDFFYTYKKKSMERRTSWLKPEATWGEWMQRYCDFLKSINSMLHRCMCCYKCKRIDNQREFHDITCSKGEWESARNLWLSIAWDRGKRFLLQHPQQLRQQQKDWYWDWTCVDHTRGHVIHRESGRTSILLFVKRDVWGQKILRGLLKRSSWGGGAERLCDGWLRKETDFTVCLFVR